jgi:4-hydroxy-4-methyl-2-oxoglutarate aldolase
VSSDLARRFAALYTGALTDVLDRHGCLRQTLPYEIAPLRSGMRVAGPAYPILGRPHPGHDYDTSIRRILSMLGSVPDGSVAVYQTNDSSVAHLGELTVRALHDPAGLRAAVGAGRAR